MVHIDLHKFVHASFIKINYTLLIGVEIVITCEDDLADSESSLSHPFCIRAHVHLVLQRILSSVLQSFAFSLLIRSDTMSSMVDWNRGT